MLMLTLGVLLWSFAHLFKRLAPTVREGMGDTSDERKRNDQLATIAHALANSRSQSIKKVRKIP